MSSWAAEMNLTYKATRLGGIIQGVHSSDWLTIPGLFGPLGLHKPPAPSHNFCFLSSTCHEKGQWECDQEPCLVDPAMIKAINRGNYG